MQESYTKNQKIYFGSNTKFHVAPKVAQNIKQFKIVSNIYLHHQRWEEKLETPFNPSLATPTAKFV